MRASSSWIVCALVLESLYTMCFFSSKYLRKWESVVFSVRMNAFLFPVRYIYVPYFCVLCFSYFTPPVESCTPIKQKETTSDVLSLVYRCAKQTTAS